MKEQLTLTIKLVELTKIVSGLKVEEYRDSKEYYHKLFKELDSEFYVVDPPKTIYLRAGYSKTSKYAIIEVDKIRHEGFFDNIPEGFKSGDLAYTIYIKKVLEHNLN